MTDSDSAFETAWKSFKRNGLAVPYSWDTSREAFAAGWRLGIEYACSQIAWDVQDKAGVPQDVYAGLPPESETARTHEG